MSDNAPLMSNGGHGPQGSYPPQGGSYGPQGGGYPPQGGQYPPTDSNYAAPPTNYQQPYQENGSYVSHSSQGGTLKDMVANGNINDIFFAAACSLIVSAVVTWIIFLFEFKVIDFIALTYLLFFGCVLAVLDTPVFKAIRGVMEAKMYIGKYIQLLTRVTGKGVVFIFLGSFQFITMWDNLQGGFFEFMAVVLCFFPIIVGGVAIVLGILKSKKLDKARRQLMVVIDQRYDQFARTFPGPNGGLTMNEFNMLTLENGGFRFQSLDLKLIFNALVTNPSWRMQASVTAAAGGQGYTNPNQEVKIPKQDMLDWCKGGFVCL